MFSQVNYWTQMVGTVVDVVLLIRILSLRLQNTYTFITLACTLSVLFDFAAIWFGFESEETQRIFLYSRFLYLFIFPLVVWDVFEEIKTRIQKIRRLAIARLLSGLLFTTVLSLVLVSFVDSDSSSNDASVLPALAVILWAGSSTASLAFLVTIYRVLRAQPLELPNNTAVWMRYYGLVLSTEVLTCFWLIVVPLIKSESISQSIGYVLLLFSIVITLWCIWRLKRIGAPDSGSAVQKPSLP